MGTNKVEKCCVSAEHLLFTIAGEAAWVVEATVELNKAYIKVI